MKAIHLLVGESVMEYLAQWGFALCPCGLSHSPPTNKPKQTRISLISSCPPQEDAFAIGEKVYDVIRKSPGAANGWAKPVVNFPTVGEIIKLEVQRLREAESAEEGAAAACAPPPGAEAVDMYWCGCQTKGPIKPKTEKYFKRHIKTVAGCPCHSMAEQDALANCRRRCIQLTCGAWRLVDEEDQSDDTTSSNHSDSIDVQHGDDPEINQTVLDTRDSLEDGSDSESRGNSSEKEDTPPNDPDVATAPKKRKRGKEENETVDDPSSFKQRVGGDLHFNKGSFDDDGVDPFADDVAEHAGIGDNTEGTEGISNDAAIPFADGEDASIYNNVEGHSRPNVLLLGMSYPDISSLFGSNADPSPRDVAEAVANGRITQIDARDLVRARALEKFADVHAYCVSLENAATYDKDRHLRANFNDVSTKTKSFLTQLQSTWPGKKFQEIILDYFWSPSSWVSDHWKSSFFSTVLPAFVTKSVLEEGGTVYLPSCLHCVCEITAAIQSISEVYRISFLHKSDLENHKLWAACNSMESDVKGNFLRWFGHAMGEEEKYCKLSTQGLGEYMCPDSKVRVGDVKHVLNQIERLEDVRIIVLSALTASEKEDQQMGGFDFS